MTCLSDAVHTLPHKRLLAWWRQSRTLDYQYWRIPTDPQFSCWTRQCCSSVTGHVCTQKLADRLDRNSCDTVEAMHEITFSNCNNGWYSETTTRNIAGSVNVKSTDDVAEDESLFLCVVSPQLNCTSKGWSALLLWSWCKAGWVSPQKSQSPGGTCWWAWPSP